MCCNFTGFKLIVSLDSEVAQSLLRFLLHTVRTDCGFQECPAAECVQSPDYYVLG